MILQSKAIMVLSIVLNMIMAGMLLGHFSHKLVVAPVSTAAAEAQSPLSKLSPDKRAIFEHIITPAVADLKTHRTEMEDAKKEAMRILKAEPFDSAAYMTQVQRISDMHTQMKGRMAASVAELAKQLSPAERVILAEIVSQPPFTLSPGMLKQPDSTSPPQ